MHLFPVLPPRTHGFAGGNLPFAAGSSGLAYLLSLLLRAARSQELTLTSSAVLRRRLPYRSWCIYSKSYLRGRTASPEVTCPLRPAPPAKHTCFHSSCERRGRRSWRPLLLLSFGEAFLTGVGASIPSISSGDARLRRRSAALCGRILRPNVPAFAPPVSGYVAGVGAYFFRCLPVKPSLQELVHLFPALAPGTHGFAGGNLPFAAGSSGQAYLLSLLLRRPFCLTQNVVCLILV